MEKNLTQNEFISFHFSFKIFCSFLTFNHTRKKQKPEIFLEFDSLDMIQNDIYTSYEKSEIGDNVLDNDPYCNHNDDQKLTLKNNYINL